MTRQFDDADGATFIHPCDLDVMAGKRHALTIVV